MVQFSKQTLVILALLLLPAIYVIAQHFSDVSAFQLVAFLIFGLLAIAVAQFGYGRSKWLDLGFDSAVAVTAAMLIFRIYPGEFYDDAGFVMRYMENFEKGFFYAYNPTDGPVFGISSPFQGLVNGALCSTGLFLPEQAIRRTAFVGLVMLIFFMIRILRKTGDKGNDFLLFTVIILVSSKMFLNVMKSGLESPMHIAVVLAAYWSYYTKRTRLMWFLLALAAISKLDAVPLVLVISFAWLVENYKSLLPISFKNKQLQAIVLFAVLPLAIWVFTAWHFFGSPLPQSAFAKIHYHSHPDDYWFPFFVHYSQNAFFFPMMLLTGFASVTMLVITFLRKTYSDFKLLLPGAGFLATLVLYYFYNPGERMMWYYAMPDILMLLQLVIALAYLIRLVENLWMRSATSLITGIAVFVFIFPDVVGGKYWLDDYLGTVEYERNQIGLYLGKNIAADDTLMTWHGLTGRYVKGYVMDMSGLNSKLVTEYKRDIAALAAKFPPNWAINTRYDEFTTVFQKPPYSLDTIFYDVTAYGYPEWLVYKRVGMNGPHDFPITLGASNVWTGKFTTTTNVNRVQGDTLQMAFHDDNAQLAGFVFGVEKSDTAYTCDMELRIKDSLIETTQFRVWPKGRIRAEDANKVQGVRWNFKTPVVPKTEAVVIIRRRISPAPLSIVDPACIQRY